MNKDSLDTFRRLDDRFFMIKLDESDILSHWYAEGWRLYRTNSRLVYEGMAFIVLVSILRVLAAGVGGIAGLLVFLLLVEQVVMMGVQFVLTRRVQGKLAVRKDFFYGFKHYFPLVMATFVFSIAVVSGLTLFLIPGIYLGIRFGQARLAVLDKETGFVEAFQNSDKLTYGRKWDLFWMEVSLWFLRALPYLPVIILTFYLIPYNSHTRLDNSQELMKAFESSTAILSKNSWYGVLSLLGTFFSYAIFEPIIFCTRAACYRWLVREKEAIATIKSLSQNR